MICPLCKNVISDDSVFCEQCGNKVPRCPNCNAVVEENARFCEMCGTRLSAGVTAPVPPVAAPQPSQQPIPQMPPQPQKKGKGWLVILVLLILAAAVLIGGHFLFGWFGSDADEDEDESESASQHTQKEENGDQAENEPQGNDTTGEAVTTTPTVPTQTQPTETQQTQTQPQQPAEQPEPVVRNVSVGDYITLGTYEQDGTYGKEDIQWLVLAVQDQKALVVSRYALECRPFDSSNTNVTWENSTIRQWLNGSFYEGAFSELEKSQILTETVSVDQYGVYTKNPGNATQDKVFLLSVSEVEMYFSTVSDRTCKPTEHAATNGAWRNSEGFGWWWLRSPGYDLDDVFCVYSHGGIDENGDGATDTTGGIRPAMWIDLTK